MFTGGGAGGTAVVLVCVSIAVVDCLPLEEALLEELEELTGVNVDLLDSEDE